MGTTGDKEADYLSSLKLGRGNTEKLTLMKERNQQNESIVSMASEKHAIRKEIDLSKLLSMHRQSLSDASIFELLFLVNLVDSGRFKIVNDFLC